jgi:hypothetical protein
MPGCLLPETAQEMAARSHSLEAEEKRRELRELIRVDLVLLRRQGMVPLAIADGVDRSVEWVVSVLRGEGFEIPGYLETTGGKAQRRFCPHCARRVRKRI